MTGFLLSALVLSARVTARAEDAIESTGTVATPTFEPKSGIYTTEQTVSISDATANASIYYTTNGSTPTSASTKYSIPVKVAETETLKAIAILSGDTNSAVNSATYTIEAATPLFAPAAGTYQAAQDVKITDTTPGAVIYYTTNGVTPTTASSRYTGPITLNVSETLKAIAVASGDSNSPVATAAYKILTVATPAFSIPAGLYNSVQKVKISDQTPGAMIYYTTDGSVPTTASIKYSSAITVSTTETLRAIAIAAGLTNSAVTSETYQVITETVLHSFSYGVNGSTDGSQAASTLIEGSDGNYYGTTTSGGAFNQGTVFKVTPTGMESVIHSFGGTATDGEGPSDRLAIGRDGNFYGTTSSGGSNASGIVFKLTPSGEETVLYAFNPGNPNMPDASGAEGLLLGTDGNFYGTSSQGGIGNGTVFQVTPAGKEKIVYSFGTGASDGSGPNSDLFEGSDGNFYGTTGAGGLYGYGTVFRVTPLGEENVLHSFSGCIAYRGCGITGSIDGANPQAGLIEGKDGNFYGTTKWGGQGAEAAACGTVFKVTPSGHETVLHSFCNSSGAEPAGALPVGPLLQGSDGNFYGTTAYGPAGYGSDELGWGTVFRITPTGTETTILTFDGGDGAYPTAGLVEASNGDLYGTTSGGGTDSEGTVFKLNKAIPAMTIATGDLSVSGTGANSSNSGLYTCYLDVNVTGTTVVTMTDGSLALTVTPITANNTVTNPGGYCGYGYQNMFNVNIPLTQSGNAYTGIQVQYIPCGSQACSAQATVSTQLENKPTTSGASSSLTGTLKYELVVTVPGAGGYTSTSNASGPITLN